jgi:hypothetical protein
MRTNRDAKSARIRTDIRSSLIPTSPNALRQAEGPSPHTTGSRSDIATTGLAANSASRRANADYSWLR